MTTDKVSEAKQTLKDHYAKTRAAIIALREREVDHKTIQTTLGLDRNDYWYHLHAAERESGKKLR